VAGTAHTSGRNCARPRVDGPSHRM
jgi:hypothetical protein